MAARAGSAPAPHRGPRPPIPPPLAGGWAPVGARGGLGLRRRGGQRRRGARATPLAQGVAAAAAGRLRRGGGLTHGRRRGDRSLFAGRRWQRRGVQRPQCCSQRQWRLCVCRRLAARCAGGAGQPAQLPQPASGGGRSSSDTTSGRPGGRPRSRLAARGAAPARHVPPALGALSQGAHGSEGGGRGGSRAHRRPAGGHHVAAAPLPAPAARAGTRSFRRRRGAAAHLPARHRGCSDGARPVAERALSGSSVSRPWCKKLPAHSSGSLATGTGARGRVPIFRSSPRLLTTVCT